jgi:hypothetical protein
MGARDRIQRAGRGKEFEAVLSRLGGSAAAMARSTPLKSPYEVYKQVYGRVEIDCRVRFLGLAFELRSGRLKKRKVWEVVMNKTEETACPICEGSKFFPQYGFNCSGKVIEQGQTYCYMCGGTGLLPKPLFKIDLTGMVRPIQWLLIGGEGHGLTLWVKAGGTVRYSCKDGSMQEYEGRSYLSEGKLFRIGVHQATSEQLAQIQCLIAENQLDALAVYA